MYIVEGCIYWNKILRFSFRPWDPQNDVVMYEKSFMVKTRVKHQTPLIRSTSYIKSVAKTKMIRPIAQVAEDSDEEDSHGSKGLTYG